MRGYFVVWGHIFIRELMCVYDLLCRFYLYIASYISRHALAGACLDGLAIAIQHAIRLDTPVPGYVGIPYCRRRLLFRVT